MGWKERGGDGRIGALFERVGLTPFWDSQEADTMDSHRLAWHAAQQSPETGERLWAALSERYFEGKHTQIRPIRHGHSQHYGHSKYQHSHSHPNPNHSKPGPNVRPGWTATSCS